MPEDAVVIAAESIGEPALALRSHADLIGALIRSTLEEVVLAISGPTPRPSHLITRIGLDKTLAGRIILIGRFLSAFHLNQQAKLCLIVKNKQHPASRP